MSTSALIPHLLAIFTLAATTLSVATPPTKDDVDFFENKIRPLLSEHCLECHSARLGKTKGGLSMDSRQSLLKGGDSGPALIPGDPSKSLLNRAARHENPDLKMPPKKARLSEEFLAPLTEWIQRGAPDPRSSDNLTFSATGPDFQKSRAHWAFQPIKRSQNAPLPSHSPNTVDALLSEARRARNLPTSDPAEPRTLIRRLSYDLTGLPPSAEDVEAFTENPTPETYRSLAQRYLDSNRFGEKWGRHWLDIARYADTRGVPVPITSDARFLYSYAYRDYVIDAYNHDKPFDQFIVEQLAADLLNNQEPQAQTALGFLTLGRSFLNNPHDIIDDRIDVITRGLMGLTVSCARCHDHKFDPVPTADYYSLYGVLSSSEVPKEPIVIREPADTPDHVDYLAQRSEKLAAAEAGLREEARALNRTLREKISKYLLAVLETEQNQPPNLDTFLSERGLVLLPFEKWRQKIKGSSSADPILGPWIVASEFSIQHSAESDFTILTAIRSHPMRSAWNPALLTSLINAAPRDISAVAGEYGKLFLSTDDAWRSLIVSSRKQNQPQPSSLTDSSLEAIRLWMEEISGPANLSLAEIEKAFSRKFLERKQKLMETVEILDGTHPGAPDRAIVLRDKINPTDAPILIRGNPANRGAAVPRRFLQVLSPEIRPAYRLGSGRLELARDIANRSNPLTARVYVNRIWALLFGQPLVSPQGDFGIRTPPPAVPELLDTLAFDFMEQGWSTKKLILSLVTSAAYQLASNGNPVAIKVDPENTFFHRMNRKRLTFESLRDTLVHASGELDLSMHGRPVLLTKAPFPLRRAVYGFVDRQDLPPVFRAFDFANPDTSTAERFQTTVPQQALFMMNNPFVIERAKSLYHSLSALNNRERIHQLYLRLFQRLPSVSESELLNRYLEQPAHASSSPSDPPLSRWESLCQALMLSNETIFID